MTIYINGQFAGSMNSTGLIDMNSGNLYNNWFIGKCNGPLNNYYFNGSIDEVRISTGARYTSNFTPPVIPFNTDSVTVGLWHFDEGSETTVKDSSKYNGNGILKNGTVWVGGKFSGILNNPPDQPSNLLCNGQINPINVNDFTPELSWTFFDPDPGDIQTGFRMIVSSDPTTQRGIVWDTGKIQLSINSVKYTGQQLQYGTIYYWKVMTFDRQSLAGQYSNIVNFVMTEPDYASQFNGTSSGGTISDSASLDISGRAITMEAWIYLTAEDNWNKACVVGRNIMDGINWTRFQGLDGYNNGHYWGFGLVIGTTYYYASIENNPPYLPKNEWVHIAGSFDGTNVR